jgi:hypothetical protein
MTTDKARSLTEQIEASVNQLATETDEARQGELFQTWLNAMAQFSHYSWNNQLLIACQRPAASSGQVAGFNAWRKLGRHVKKGAKGIAILAPCVYRKKADDTKEDSPTVKRLSGFKTAYVFCESDTEGEPLPTLTYGAESGGEELLSRLEWVTEEDLNIILDYEEIKEDGVEGYSAGGRIVIRTSLSPTAKAGVVVHELAHLCCQGIYVVTSVGTPRSLRKASLDGDISSVKSAESNWEALVSHSSLDSKLNRKPQTPPNNFESP